jgi:uncharacterized protein YjbI with pentapeptide repeats
VVSLKVDDKTPVLLTELVKTITVRSRKVNLLIAKNTLIKTAVMSSLGIAVGFAVHLPQAIAQSTRQAQSVEVQRLLNTKQCPGCNLSGANLQNADLEEANLRGANLQGANLQNADLEQANLQDANLQQANLSDADLQEANLQNANLQNANLRSADLEDANLQGTNLDGANLQGADLEGTIRANQNTR